MKLAEVRRKYLEFMQARGHAVIPSASLVPENDPTTLFTGSGMQPLVPYLLGQPHPAGKRVADSQKSFRAEDIEEVGDNRHTTFFEMLGNWSFGDYWKQEQLPWIFEFLRKEIGLDPKNLYVTVFAGDPATGIPADEESIGIWKNLFAEQGIDAKYVELGSEKEGSAKGMQAGRIFSYDVKKNWWSRAGVPANMPAGEPGGPDSEIFYDFGTAHDSKFGEHCHPNCDCGRFLEIGNSVFMEYIKKEDGSFEKLKQRNVDFGGGLERITAASEHDSDVFRVDVLAAVLRILTSRFNKEYASEADTTRSYRVISDHIRAAVFLLGDGVLPSNKERGYLLRRLIRRAVFEAHRWDSSGTDWLAAAAEAVILDYEGQYHALAERRAHIVTELAAEAKKFLATLDSGMHLLYKRLSDDSREKRISAEEAFQLFTTYGFPLELTVAKAEEMGFTVDLAGFDSLFKQHQELSRTASAGAFKGGLADHSEKVIQLHTTHHLLLKALQMVLGGEVKQRGSNITGERLRIDFSYGAKMTDDEKKEVERIVNEKIAEDLPVLRTEMAKEEAEKLGAEHEFGQKYPDTVSVYSVGPKDATFSDPKFSQAFSIEFCGGPHVTRTGEIKGTFRIQKEEASSSGIRRVKGVLE